VGIAGQRGLPAHAILAGIWNGLVALLRALPPFITIVATTIAIALFIVARRRRADPERKLEQRDPNRPDVSTGPPFTRPSMRG
jgi:hypothetical protein